MANFTEMKTICSHGNGSIQQRVGARLAEPREVMFKALIHIYQFTRILRPACCRFYPSCSDYCLQAIDTYGLIQGIALTLRRLLKCHPWHSGGVDLVSIDRAYSIAERGEEPCAAQRPNGVYITPLGLAAEASLRRAERSESEAAPKKNLLKCHPWHSGGVDLVSVLHKQANDGGAQ
jgi:putative membrane protein insertion efficiency factor